MSQSLPQELETYVQQKLESGEFRSRDEFECETIRVYRDLEQRHTELKNAIVERICDADAGNRGPLDIEAIKARGRQQLSK